MPVPLSCQGLRFCAEPLHCMLSTSLIETLEPSQALTMVTWLSWACALTSEGTISLP